MQAHGATSAGEIFWAVAIMVAVPLGLTLKSGAFAFFVDRPITIGAQPVRYWSIVTILTMAVIVLLAVGWRANITGHVFMTPG